MSMHQWYQIDRHTIRPISNSRYIGTIRRNIEMIDEMNDLYDDDDNRIRWSRLYDNTCHDTDDEEEEEDNE